MLRNGSDLSLVRLLLVASLLGCGGSKLPIQPAHPAPPAAVTSPATPPAPTIFETSPALGVTILSDTQGVDFRLYVQRVVIKLKAQWLAEMPEEATMGDKARVTLLLTILPDGAVSADGTQIASGANIPSLDKAVLDAVRRSAPFESLPRPFYGPSLKLRIIFLYNIAPSEGLKPTAGKD